MGFRIIAVALAVFLPSQPALAQSGNTSPRQPSESTAKPWWERLTFFGDLRVRYEGFFQEDSETRQRGRYRLRLGLRTSVAEGLDVTLRLASGDAADVNSTNQTLTDFFNRKPINIDQASLSFRPPSVPALTLGAGKFGYPVTRTQLVWDDDVNWEGAYEQLGWSIGATNVRLAAAQSPLNDVGSGRDAFLFAESAQVTMRFARTTLLLSLADYAFRNPDPLAVALAEREVIRTQQTNGVRRDEAGRVIGYQSGFNLVDTIARATFDTGRGDYPLVALADIVVNTRAANDDDGGLWLSASYGRASTPNTFAAGYTFARVEQDAVVSAYNFSDMGPATNVVMNMATFSFMPRNRLNLDATAIFTKLLRVPPGAANPLLTRIQLDARVSF